MLDAYEEQQDGGKIKPSVNLDTYQNLFYFLGNDNNHDRVHHRVLTSR